jgi:hypothetical protein
MRQRAQRLHVVLAPARLARATGAAAALRLELPAVRGALGPPQELPGARLLEPVGLQLLDGLG